METLKMSYSEYSYKGTGLNLSGGIGQNRKRPSGHSPLFFLILLLVIASLLFGAWKILSAIRSSEPNNNADSTAEDGASSGNRGRRTAPKATPVDQKTLKSALNIYNRAQNYFNAKQYSRTRNVLRPLFDILPSDHPLYLKAQLLLGKASTALFQNDQSAEQDYELYTVGRGDSLSRIAKKFNTTVADLQLLNGMAPNVTMVRLGQKMKIARKNGGAESDQWRILLRPSRNQLLLFNRQFLFKVYTVSAGNEYPKDGIGLFRITSKQKNPSWTDGEQLYEYGNPRNILGSRKLELTPSDSSVPVDAVWIHGTNVPTAIGRNEGARGQISMMNNDINELFTLIPEGSIVEIEP